MRASDETPAAKWAALVEQCSDGNSAYCISATLSHHYPNEPDVKESQHSREGVAGDRIG